MNICLPPLCTATTPAPDAQAQIVAAFDALTTMGVAIGLSVCALMILIGGYKYMTSRGNPIAQERAKASLEHAGIGFAIVLLATVLASLVKSVLHVA